eukprot:scaffold708_cov70-Phaeocystis_antarctica.AAC.2
MRGAWRAGSTCRAAAAVAVARLACRRRVRCRGGALRNAQRHGCGVHQPAARRATQSDAARRGRLPGRGAARAGRRLRGRALARPTRREPRNRIVYYAYSLTTLNTPTSYTYHAYYTY